MSDDNSVEEAVNKGKQGRHGKSNRCAASSLIFNHLLMPIIRKTSASHANKDREAANKPREKPLTR